jgi:hypothetical protein
MSSRARARWFGCRTFGFPEFARIKMPLRLVTAQGRGPNLSERSERCRVYHAPLASSTELSQSFRATRPGTTEAFGVVGCESSGGSGEPGTRSASTPTRRDTGLPVSGKTAEASGSTSTGLCLKRLLAQGQMGLCAGTWTETARTIDSTTWSGGRRQKTRGTESVTGLSAEA